MPEKDSTVLRRIWRSLYKPLLEDLFKTYASIRVQLTPDWAMEEMDEVFSDVFRRINAENGPEAKKDPGAQPRPIFRFDESAFTREAHHYAVDLFYRTYFPRRSVEGKSRRGAPSLPTDYVDRILQLMRRGLGYAEIAKNLGQPKDRMRKQVKAAEKRWSEALGRIEELKRKYPHIVAPDPRVTEGKNRPSN
jgi:hypothetical protein